MNKTKPITNADALRIKPLLPYQSQLIFDFAIETGLRIGDILQLRKCEIAQTMHVREAKTKKYKLVTISDELFSRLPAGFHCFGRYPYAFSSPRTLYKPLNRSTYHLHLKKACKALGIDFSAHSTRKLYAKNVFELTGDIFEVQKAMNHAFVATTCAYLDIDVNKLIQDVKKP
jgi:integrase